MGNTRAKQIVASLVPQFSQLDIVQKCYVYTPEVIPEFFEEFNNAVDYERAKGSSGSSYSIELSDAYHFKNYPF